MSVARNGGMGQLINFYGYIAAQSVPTAPIPPRMQLSTSVLSTYRWTFKSTLVGYIAAHSVPTVSNTT